MNRIKNLLLVLILLTLIWQTHTVEQFTSVYKYYPIRWGANIYSENEYKRVLSSWYQELTIRGARIGSLLWIPPYSENSSGLLEISFYEKKDNWYDIWY